MLSDHDTSYRQLFAHPELVCELLAHALPGAFAKRLDAAACKRVNGSYTSEAGHQRHDDMVWCVQRCGAPDVYVLLEFQSRPDRSMALRMNVYAGLLLQDLLKQGLWQLDGPLPLVLPLVLHSGERVWSCGVSLGELRSDNGGVEDYQPQQRYVLVDLARQSHTVPAGEDTVVLALFQCTASGMATRLLPALGCITRWLDAQANAALRRDVTRWVVRQLRLRFKRITIPRNWTLEEVNAMCAMRFDTPEDQLLYEIGEQCRQEGRQKGLQEGRQEGRQEGLREGIEPVRYTVLRLLEREHGPVPAVVAAKVDAAAPGQLRAWLDQLLDGAPPSGLLPS